MTHRGRVLSLLILPGLACSSLFTGCGLLPGGGQLPAGRRSMIVYWPPPKHSTKMRLAVKDNIDMKGLVTTAGSEYLSKNSPPAKKDAPCLAIARQRDLQWVGKTNMSEFAVAPSGFNEYYGTPKNPQAHWKTLIPGGSSCGSAVSVARGLTDVAFGTDTAGSVRVPAACCGVVGLKTTFGLVSTKGIYPIEAQHLDTVGPLAKNIETTAKGMDLLESGFMARYQAAQAAKPSAQQIRIGRLRLKGTDSKIDDAIDAALTKAGFQVVPLGDDFRKAWDQATDDGNTIAAAGAWISDRQYLTKPGVSTRTKAVILVGRVAYATGYQKAVARQHEWQNQLSQVFKKVDLIALPTLQSTPPVLLANLKIGVLEVVMLKTQNTVAVNFAGNPALAVPVPLPHGGVPLTSLQLVGPRKSEAELLNAGRLVEAAVHR